MSRIDDIRDILKKKELDSLLLSDVTEVSWATGFSGDDSHCIVTKSDAVFFTDFRYTEQAGKEVTSFVTVETGGDNRLDYIGKYAGARVGIDFERTSMS